MILACIDENFRYRMIGLLEAIDLDIEFLGKNPVATLQKLQDNPDVTKKICQALSEKKFIAA
jgi:hypothetical protein